MESANNDARKWPILPFDVSRDFIISNLSLDNDFSLPSCLRSYYGSGIFL
jgi:hypothetical protein